MKLKNNFPIKRLFSAITNVLIFGLMIGVGLSIIRNQTFRGQWDLSIPVGHEASLIVGGLVSISSIVAFYFSVKNLFTLLEDMSQEGDG